MKNIVYAFCFSVILSGCSTFSGMFNLKEHDPALALAWVDTKITINDAFCEDYDSLENAYYQAVWMNEYVLFVNDPQKETAGSIVRDIDNAMEQQLDNFETCERFLKIARLKLNTLQKAWSSR